MPEVMKKLIRWLARHEIQRDGTYWYEKGLAAGRDSAPRECGALQHHPSDYWYDPGC